MKKRIFSMAAVLVLALSLMVPAAGAQTKAGQGDIILDIDGTTATCFVDYVSPKPTDSVKITMVLWRGSSSVYTWRASGTGGATLEETCAVVPGNTYKLVVTPVVNGVTRPQISVTDYT